MSFITQHLWFTFWSWLKYFCLKKKITACQVVRFNLVSKRFAQGKHFSCACANVNYSFLIMHHFYWMCTPLRIVPFDTWRFLALAPMDIPGFTSIIMFCTWCTNCDVLVLFKYHEFFLTLAAGNAFPLEDSNSFRILCTNDLVTSKKLQSQRHCDLHV